MEELPWLSGVRVDAILDLFQAFEKQLLALEQHTVRLATILGLTPESRWAMKIPHEKDALDLFKAEELRQLREATRDA